MKFLSQPEENFTLACQEYHQGQTIVQSLPPTVILGLTTRCNNRIPCLICTRNVRDESIEQDIDEKVISAMQPLIRTARFLLLHVAGEPMMSKHFDEMVASVEPPTRISFATNAALLTRNRAENMLRRDVMGRIVVSLDASSPEMYRIMRPGSSYEQVIENVRYYIHRARELGRTQAVVDLNMTLCKANLTDMPKLPELALAIGASHISFQRLNPGGKYTVQTVTGKEWDYQDQMTFENPLNIDQILLETCQAARDAGLSAKYMGRLDPAAARNDEETRLAQDIMCSRSFEDDQDDPQIRNHQNDPVQCDKFWKQIIVSPDGNVRACCYHRMPDCLGNIRTQDFMTMWNSEQMIAWRANILSGHWPDECIRTSMVCMYRGRR